MDIIIPFTIETQIHTSGPIWVPRFIAGNVPRIASTIHVIVMRKFSPVFCISVFIEKRNYEIDFNL